jgi:hypothetical protein
MKPIGKTKSKIYKGVYTQRCKGRDGYWFARGSINGKRFAIYAKTEREAGLKYDMKMIENGKEPVNVLKRK